MCNTNYNTGLAKWTHGEEMRGDWHKYLGPCPKCGSPTFDYGGGWRCLAMYCFNNASNPAPSVGPTPTWWNKGIQVVRDGNAWCAHGADFLNLQESNCAFGSTPDEAVSEYLKIAA